MEVEMTDHDAAGGPGPARVRRSREASGQHVRCAEAQADGVPCTEPWTDCECCVHGLLAVWRDGRWVELPLTGGREPSPAS
jgi:hypothetical protein